MGLQLKILQIRMGEFVQLFQIPNIIFFRVHHGLKLFRKNFISSKKHSIFDVAGACYFAKKYDLSYMMGFLNSGRCKNYN